MPNAVKLEVSVVVEITEDNALKSVSKVLVDGKQVGFISRLRVDVDSDEVVPSVEIDMIRGQSLDLLPESLRAKVQEGFDALKKVPGVRCTMPAPRK